MSHVKQRIEVPASEPETASLGKNIADLIEERQSIDRQRKSAAKTYKEKIDEIEARIIELKDEILRNVISVDATVEFNTPSSGLKTATYATANGYHEKVLEMTEEEAQQLFAS